MKMNVLERQAVGDAVAKALTAKPVTFHLDRDKEITCFEIDGEIYTAETAKEKVLGTYSWWQDEPKPIRAA